MRPARRDHDTGGAALLSRQRELEAARHAAITVGLTELQADDGLEDLIARADAAMSAARAASPLPRVVAARSGSRSQSEPA